MARVALVTGGIRGIGAGIAVALHGAGHKVAVNYRGDDEVARRFTEQSGIAAFKWDVADHEACKAGVAQVEAALGAIEILVNNAGTVTDAKFENLTFEQWHLVLRTNLDSCFYMSQLVYRGMKERKFGRIVNIGSMNGQAGQLNQANYVAAKAGMHGLTKAIALEGAKHGITANTVAPGYLDTYMMRTMPERIKQKILDKSPVRRFGQPDEVAHAVLFLVDEKAAWTTGSTITMNGGSHMY